MKKLILILTLVAFSFPLMQTSVEAAPRVKTIAIKNHKKAHKAIKHKKGGRKHHKGNAA
jgi:fumarate reductase subunit C